MRPQLVNWGTALILVTALPSSAWSESFRITKIADTSATFAHPAINNAGTVVFTRIGAVVTGNGGSLTTIADSSGFLGDFFSSDVSINDSGRVSFTSTRDAGGVALFSSIGGQPTLIAETGTRFSNVGFTSSINNSGTVAFRAFEDGVGFRVFTGNGGSLTPIASSTEGFIEEHVSINGAGTVAFSGGGLSSSDLVGLFTGSGGAVTPIADDSGPLDFPFLASINDVGTAAFVAQLDAGGNGLFLGGTQVRPFADTNGLFSFFFALAPSLNDAGEVAFGAGLDGGGTGIFVGPNPLADKVITTGDSLFGSTVTSLSLGSQALNNAGQVAFYAELSDGTQSVFVATPVPEPSTLLLYAAGLAGLAAGRGWHDSGFRRGPRLRQ